MATKNVYTPTAVVCGASVRVNADGLYSLNDMHEAAKDNGYATDSQRPGAFLDAEGVQLFIAALEGQNRNAGFPAFHAVESKRGNGGGTWAHELVALRYAAWINPNFEVQVYETFSEVAKDKAAHQKARSIARMEFRPLTDALQQTRAEQGKVTAGHHYSNEADMLNRIVLGCTSKQFKAKNNLTENDNIRDHLKSTEIIALETLQRHDTALIECGDSFDERKAKLTGIFDRRFSGRIKEQYATLIS